MNTRALRPNAQAFDEVRIRTVPRYKTSGLSGNEWRISAVIEFYRKGRLVHEQSFGKVESAVNFLPYAYASAIDNGKAYFAGEGDLCDQEGCAEKATVTYRIKKLYCNEPYMHEPKTYAGNENNIRMFCEEHSRRGDCAFDDADANYELLKAEEPKQIR